jgi:hypothetical protein
MSELDDLLQKKLEAIERRASPRKTPKGLTGDAAEFESLIHLAATLRSMPHPRLGEESSQAMQQKLLETAKLTMRPQNRVNPFNLSWLLKPGLAGLTLVFVSVLVLVFGGVWLSGPSVAHTATLHDLTGQVQVADRADAEWKNVTAGTVLSVGQHLRTLDNSNATVQFFDGTRTTLAANTGLVLSEMSGSWRTELQVRLSQQYGLTTHEVVALVGEKSHFIVDTPSGAASVRGTAFSVAVAPQGASYISVENGSVQVENNLGQVALQSGQGTAVLPSQAPLSPAYTFTLNATLTVQADGSLGLANSSFAITSSTFSVAGLQPGASVQVTGRILEDGKWVVDILQPAKEETGKFAFKGVVEEMSPESWTISGIPVQIDPATQWDGAIQVGDTVEVKVVILGSGGWRALEIVAVIEPIPATTIEEGVATQEPVKPVAGPESLPPPDCTGAEPHPEALTLAGRYGVASEEIMGWFCQGFGFGEIDLAYSLMGELNITDVTEIFVMRADGQSWGAIKQSFSAQSVDENKPTAKPANENKPPTKTPAPAIENQPDKEVKPSKTPKP